jgi:hypothetical protein
MVTIIRKPGPTYLDENNSFGNFRGFGEGKRYDARFDQHVIWIILK